MKGLVAELGNTDHIILLKDINAVIYDIELWKQGSDRGSDGAFEEGMFFILRGSVITSAYPAIPFDPCPPASLDPKVVGA